MCQAEPVSLFPSDLAIYTSLMSDKAIHDVNVGSWKGQKSRQHIVFKVYPFQSGKTNEVMLYGMSKYVYDDETTGEMSWAARLCFQRSENGSILINFYHIFPVSHWSVFDTSKEQRLTDMPTSELPSTGSVKYVLVLNISRSSK